MSDASVFDMTSVGPLLSNDVSYPRKCELNYQLMRQCALRSSIFNKKRLVTEIDIMEYTVPPSTQGTHVFRNTRYMDNTEYSVRRIVFDRRITVIF